MTSVFLSLLLCTFLYKVFAEVREPPVCPVLLRPKTCTTGVSDICSKDSDCPVFTRCCDDGCNKRCIDTSSKLAIHSMRSKYGICPRHTMNKKCTAMFDLCLDDSYCLGDEKCCVDKDCGRKCMLPNILHKIKNSTKAFNCPYIKPRSSKCRGRSKNHCTMDSECPTYTTCCFDGCKRRCTDRKGRMVPNKKGSLCPMLPPPVACPYSFKECHNDNDCGMGMKCCSDTCNFWCMPSHPPPAVESIPDPGTNPDKTKTSFRDFTKPGRCPILEKPKSCDGHNHQCNYDVDCWNSDRKCCDNGCATICVEPVTVATRYVNWFTTVRTTLKTEQETKEPTTPKSSTQRYTTERLITKAPTTKTMTLKTPSPNPPPTQAPTTPTTPSPNPPPTQAPTTPTTPSPNPPPTQAPTTPTTPSPNPPPTQAPTTPTTPSPNPPPTQAPTTPTTRRSTTEKPTRKATSIDVRTTEETDAPTFLPRTRINVLTTVEPIETTIKKLDPTPSSSGEVVTRRIPASDRQTTESFLPWFSLPSLKPTSPLKDGIRISPPNYEAKTGENIKVTCTIKGEPFEGWYTPKGLKITAEKDGSMYIYGRGDDYTLVINNVGQMYGGKYTCRGAFTSANYELNIKLSIDASKDKQILYAGTTGIIKVSAKGYPRPTSTWIKDGYPISVLSGRHYISPSGSLIIKNVQISDKGHYSIMADHYYMKSHHGLYSSLVGNSDTVAIIVDVIRGKKESRYCPYLHPPLKCPSTSKQCSSDDQCTANQKCCSDSCHVRCVASHSSNSELIPGVQTYPTIKGFCNPHQSIRLVCRIDNQPFEGWFDTYGRKVLPLTHGNRMMVENHYEYQVLVMKNVTAKDGGKYTCQGALDSASVDVNVNRTIAEYEHPTMLYPGQAGLFLQNIQCYPLPRFIWYKRGRPLDLSSHRYSISPSGSLGIRRIRSSDMGVYTLKIQMGEQMRDTGVKVAAAVDGVDFTEWQDTLAPGATVRCQKDVMYIDLDRKSLIGYSAVDLSLQNTSCRATSNKTHYSLQAPLVGCGTEIKFTHEAVVYTNMVKEYRSDGMITRIQDITIPFSCFYTKEGVTSTFGVLPTKVRRVMDGGNVTTKFELGMSLYRDESYSVSFGVADFPLRVTVNRPLFVQVKIHSPDKRLSVISERCYATPTQDPRHPMQYDIINDGCGVDPTVKFYKGAHTLQRFSFKAFQFLAKGKQFVYLHCHLLVCNVSDTTSRCAQGCQSSLGRLRRAAPRQPTEVELTQGPFILEKLPAASGQHSGSSNFKDYIWIMVGMAGFCVMCLIAMFYMKKQIRLRSKQPELDPDRETNV